MEKDKKMRELMEAWNQMESLVSRTPIEGPAMVEAKITDTILVNAELNSHESDVPSATYEISMNDLIADWSTLKSTVDQAQLKDIIDDSLAEYIRDTYNVPLDTFTWKFITP